MLHNLFGQSVLSDILMVVVFGGILQGFFLALVLTTKKNKSRKSNRMLAALLLILSFSILHGVIASDNFGPYKIKEPMILLIGPFILFYVLESAGVRVKGWKTVYHFIPFLLFFLIALLGWVLGAASSYSEFLFQYSATISIVVWMLIVVQYGFYWAATVRIIHRNISLVESEFSNIEGKTLSWLTIFLHVFGILLILFVGTVIFALHSSHYSEVDTIVSFGLSCAIFVLGYEGLFQEEIFSTSSEIVDVTEAKVKQISEREEDEERAAKIAEDIVAYFEGKKPYLDDGLTLTKLAEQIGVTRNQLSAVINNRFESNFYNFVNKYRVEEVKRLMTDPKNKDFTILSLAFQAGFPSKSSFQDVFKRFTGLTPTEYQRKAAVRIGDGGSIK